MCTKPLLIDGQKVGCRSCNECVASRRINWVARAMAEKATAGQALVVCLTYGNDTQFQRDGSAMFRYADVRLFMARLRAAIHHETGQREVVSFLCAGEQGDRSGRCHWHVLLFAKVDLLTFGKWSDRYGVVTDPDRIISHGSTPRRMNWSLWPHGFVTVQEPDEGGMNYALSYALKDQFTAEKSAGTFRETKVETYATGLFRMSKHPPIGHAFLKQTLAELEANGDVLPDLRVTVPDLKQRWFPTGLTRRFLLQGLRRINDERKARTGTCAPQWKSLLASCGDNIADLEILTDGEEEEPIEKTIDFRKRERAAERAARQIGRRCRSTIPCADCLTCATDAELSHHHVERYTCPDGTTDLRFEGSEDGQTLRAAQSDCAGAQRPHAICALAGTQSFRLALPETARHARGASTPLARSATNTRDGKQTGL